MPTPFVFLLVYFGKIPEMGSLGQWVNVYIIYLDIASNSPPCFVQFLISYSKVWECMFSCSEHVFKYLEFFAFFELCHLLIFYEIYPLQSLRPLCILEVLTLYSNLSYIPCPQFVFILWFCLLFLHAKLLSFVVRFIAFPSLLLDFTSKESFPYSQVIKEWPVFSPNVSMCVYVCILFVSWHRVGS